MAPFPNASVNYSKSSRKRDMGEMLAARASSSYTRRQRFEAASTGIC
jgi:hypothetical protein